MGEEIETIDRHRGGHKAIGAMQRDKDASERRLFIGILQAVAVGIEVDKVADRPQRLEGDSVTGSVITGDGIANGAGVGGVGDRLGAVGGGGNGDNGGGTGQQGSHRTSKRASGQIATRTGDSIKDHPARLGVGDGDAGDGNAGGVAHSDSIGKGRADGDGSRAGFGNSDITHGQTIVVGAGGCAADSAACPCQRPVCTAAAVVTIVDTGDTLPVAGAVCSKAGPQQPNRWRVISVVIGSTITHIVDGIGIYCCAAAVHGEIITTSIAEAGAGRACTSAP
jgi:hypothetical protein